jgi:hypothetical protein
MSHADFSASLVGERELDVILQTVDAAITVRHIDGRMVYANQAAAELLRLPTPQAVMSQPPGHIMELFDVYSEEGDPVSLAELPGSRLLAGERAPAPMIVRNVVRETGEERWLLNKASAVIEADGRVLMAVNLVEDITDTKRNEIAQRLLARTARLLAFAADPDAAFQVIADAAVPGLADWAGVDILDSTGRIVTVAVAHRDPEKVRLGWRLRQEWPVDPRETEGLPAVIRTGEAQLIPEITDTMLELGAHSPEHLEVLRGLGLNSTMITPIRAGGRVLGSLSFVSSTSRRFDQRDLTLACDLGRQVGMMVNNAQMAAEHAHIARTLQAGLIPSTLPELEGWTVSRAYRAAGRANAVGGDFYDIVRSPRGWAAIIGDVLGKGAAAASLTALARHTVAAIVESTGDVPHALTVLNRRLRERDEDFQSLCTIAVVEVSAAGEAVVHCAGHPLPLCAAPGSVREVGTPSPMLGFLDAVEVTPTVVEVGVGERIVLYTDGVLDAVGVDGRFGERGLAEALLSAEGYGGEPVAQVVMEAIDAFLAGEQNDDIAILSLTRTPVPAAALR